MAILWNEKISGKKDHGQTLEASFGNEDGSPTEDNSVSSERAPVTFVVSRDRRFDDGERLKDTEALCRGNERKVSIVVDFILLHSRTSLLFSPYFSLLYSLSLSLALSYSLFLSLFLFYPRHLQRGGNVSLKRYFVYAASSGEEAKIIKKRGEGTRQQQF